MQAGFALVETGFCRAKHAAHVVATNFAIFGLGFVAFFVCGYAFMFGGYSFPNLFGYNAAIGSSLIGSGHWTFLWKGGFFLGDKAYDVSVCAWFLYMVAFMDTTATIPTGAMAERWKWKSFCLWGLFCGGIYYPLFGAWTWGGGWLSQLGNSLKLGFGYVDFAGSGVVHAMGGVAGLAGAMVLGARIGKYGPDGKPRTLAGHHIPMAMLGTFILLFGWFGFNAASTGAATDLRFAVVAVNTAIAAAFGATIGMGWVWLRSGKPDPGMMANGMLAGLVAITAPCAFVQPWAAAVIGSIAAPLVIEAVWFFERKAKIDDPVGARSRSTVSAGSSACCASGCSPTAATARAGTSPSPPRPPTTGSPDSSTTSASAAVSSSRRWWARRSSAPSCSGSRSLSSRSRTPSPRAGSDPSPRSSSPASTSMRWACSPTPSSRARTSTSRSTQRARTYAGNGGDVDVALCLGARAGGLATGLGAAGRLKGFQMEATRVKSSARRPDPTEPVDVVLVRWPEELTSVERLASGRGGPTAPDRRRHAPAGVRRLS